jgi:arylsulfatase A-like enzyme
MQLTRRTAGTLLAGLTAFGQQRRRRPNILYVMTDDHPADCMSCAGHRILKTPHMDRLAAEGVRFSNCFVTNSLCAPARATALSGCFSHVNGVRGNSEAKDAPPEFISAGVITYPELLKKAGYRTAVVGKWHLNDAPKGFDYSCILPGQGLYFDPEFIEGGVRKKIPGYATDITTDKALQWLDGIRAQPDEPWLLVYQHKAPHRPFQPAPRHAGLWTDVELPYPATFDDDYATRKLAQEAEDMRFDSSLARDYEKEIPKGLTAAEKKRWIYQRFVKDHYRATVGVDENLGRVLDYLDRHKLAEDTVVIYTSDNGFFLGDHGWYDKRWMYEPSLRIPLLVRYPRLGVRGRVDKAFVQNIDFAPTILDLAGVPIPEQMQGRSLRPMLEGRVALSDWRRSVYYTYYENSWAQLAGKGREALRDPSFAYLTPHRVPPHRGVRTERYKLIEYYGEGNYKELFDLQKDPNELRNLYGNAGYSQVTAELEAELQRLRRQYRDV